MASCLSIFDGLKRTSIYVLVLSLILLAMSLGSQASQFPLAVYYKENNIPIPQLKLYPKVVVQPNTVFDPKKFDTATHRSYAYVSVGEIPKLDFYGKSLDAGIILGKNHAWNTLIIDQTAASWPNFFLKQIIHPLWEKGYRGFYLDTLDSYRQVSSGSAALEQKKSLVALIKAIKKTYPDADLILNRGFELLPEVHDLIAHITVESVFSGWDNQKKQYFEVSPKERYWVLEDIRKAQHLGVPVTVIDYVGQEPRQQAHIERLVHAIEDIGCTAWISNADLSALYVHNVEVLPRKILMFYQGDISNVDQRIGSSAINNLAMPLNYLGYVVELRNVNQPLPEGLSKQDYAGIVMAIDGILLGREHELYSWYLRQIQAGIPLVIFNDFGFLLENEELSPFGLYLSLHTHNSHHFTTLHDSLITMPQVRPPLRSGQAMVHVIKGKGTSLLTVQDEVGAQTDVSAIMPWGGYYLGDSFLPETALGEHHWAMHPFLFYKKALRLKDTPIPDTTTENGRRLMFTHVDGDGFANKGQWFEGPFLSQIMLHEFFRAYGLPTTVSIIQAEIAKDGMHPKDSTFLEKIAREIFSLPNVEIASHSYSHPYNWQKALAYRGTLPNPYHLPLNNYGFNLNKEIEGSVSYINQELAPPGKKCKMFLWSGEGDIPQRALALVSELGLRNLNPGRIMSKLNPSVTQVSANGMNIGDYFQVFAPIGNDQEVQGLLHEKYFYSLKRIINVLKLTDAPHRLKPIDIYVHFFSMAQPGGIKGLHAVYQWVLKQPIFPIFASEYVDKINDFNHLVLAEKNGGWLVETSDELRELRIPQVMGYPDLKESHRVMGFNAHNQDFYIHLAPGGEAFLKLKPTSPKEIYLVDANARMIAFASDGKKLKFSLQGEFLPIQFTLAHSTGCSLAEGYGALNMTKNEGGKQYYTLSKKTSSEVKILCH